MSGWLNKSGEHERVAALLSPYLDGQVSQAERALVERHLASCAECAHDFATLKATATAVRTMPRAHAPQTFTLPRSMARQSQTTTWMFPALRAATALATLLLVIIVAGDVFLFNAARQAAAPVSAPASVARQPLVQPTASEAQIGRAHV
jgi:anti-sigma factor RsiW